MASNSFDPSERIGNFNLDINSLELINDFKQFASGLNDHSNEIIRILENIKVKKKINNEELSKLTELVGHIEGGSKGVNLNYKDLKRILGVN